MPPFSATTEAIDARGFLDPRCTCDLDNSSPEIRWQDAPEQTQSFAVTLEAIELPGQPMALVDSRERPVTIPQGSRFAHWVVYNIPESVRHLPPGIPPQETLPNGIRQGINGAAKLGYLGPCPPRGPRTRSYLIRVFALSGGLDLPSRLGLDQLLATIAPWILAEAQIRSHYSRTQIARPA